MDGRNDAAWTLILITLTAMFVFRRNTQFTIGEDGLGVPAAFGILLGVLAFFYHRLRPDARITSMTLSLLQMTIFSAAGALLSYMVAARGGPLWDNRIADWDRALGLDWLGWLHWLDSHASIARLLRLAYVTLIPQMVAIIVLLSLSGRLRELRISIFASMLAGFVTIMTSALVPALGTYTHFALSPLDYPHLQPAAPFLHMKDLNGLRSGLLRTISLANIQGIITFPSYHAALATVYAWSFLRVPWRTVRWAGVVVAILTLIATPVDGGHYFSDVIAGCLIASASIWMSRRAIRLDIFGNMPRKIGLRSSPSRHLHAASAP